MPMRTGLEVESSDSSISLAWLFWNAARLKPGLQPPYLAFGELEVRCLGVNRIEGKKVHAHCRSPVDALRSHGEHVFRQHYQKSLQAGDLPNRVLTRGR
ncbi:hypothetical protein KC326_g152 [Hortaea werneckii]|nr:hypothetical protein KC326_g152 [Hortaea werneckii]